MKTKAFTFTNDFHNTECTVRAKLNERGEWTLSEGQVKKVYRTLCGIPGCTCGDEMGRRGDENTVIYHYDNYRGVIDGAVVYGDYDGDPSDDVYV